MPIDPKYGKSYSFKYETSNSFAWQLVAVSIDASVSYSLSLGTNTNTNINILDHQFTIKTSFASSVNLSANLTVTDTVLNSENFIGASLAIPTRANLGANRENIEDVGYDKLRDYLSGFGSKFSFDGTDTNGTSTSRVSYYDTFITNYHSYQNYQNNFIVHSDGNVTLTDAAGSIARPYLTIAPFLITNGLSSGLSSLAYFPETFSISLANVTSAKTGIGSISYKEISNIEIENLWVKFSSANSNLNIEEDKDYSIKLMITDCLFKIQDFVNINGETAYTQYELLGSVAIYKDDTEIAKAKKEVELDIDLKFKGVLSTRILILKVRNGDKLSNYIGSCKPLVCKDFIWQDRILGNLCCELKLVISDIDDDASSIKLISPFTRNENVIVDDKYKNSISINSIENDLYYGSKEFQNIGLTVNYSEDSKTSSCKFNFPIRNISYQKALIFADSNYLLKNFFDLIGVSSSDNSYVVPIVDSSDAEKKSTNDKTLHVVQLSNGEVSIIDAENDLKLNLTITKPSDIFSSIGAKLSLGQTIKNDDEELKFSDGTTFMETNNLEDLLDKTLLICSKNIKCKGFGGYTYKYIFFKIYYDVITGKILFEEIPVFDSRDLSNLVESLEDDIRNDMLPLNIMSTAAPLVSMGVGAAAAGLFSLFSKSNNNLGLLIDASPSEERKGSIFSLAKKCMQISVGNKQMPQSQIALSKENTEASLIINSAKVSFNVGGSSINLNKDKTNDLEMKVGTSSVSIDNNQIILSVENVNFTILNDGTYTYKIGAGTTGKITRDLIDFNGKKINRQ